MARYFLHLRNSASELLDPDGSDFADFEALKCGVLCNVRDVISGDVRNGFVDLRHRIDAESEAGEVVYSLAFKDAVSIIPEELQVS